jgi:hypothetical protein
MPWGEAEAMLSASILNANNCGEPVSISDRMPQPPREIEAPVQSPEQMMSILGSFAR